MQFLGIDWAYRRAAFCGLSESGAITGEGFVPADEDGLARLVLAHGTTTSSPSRRCDQLSHTPGWAGCG